MQNLKMLARKNSLGRKWHVEVGGEASAPRLFGSFDSENEALHWISGKVAEVRHHHTGAKAAAPRLVEVLELVVRV